MNEKIESYKDLLVWQKSKDSAESEAGIKTQLIIVKELGYLKEDTYIDFFEGVPLMK